MSLTAPGYSTALQSTIQKGVDAGIVFVAAAGNENQDVYGADGIFGNSDDVFPASFPEVATISALSDTDGQPGGLGPLSSYQDWIVTSTATTMAWTTPSPASVISVAASWRTIR